MTSENGGTKKSVRGQYLIIHKITDKILITVETTGGPLEYDLPLYGLNMSEEDAVMSGSLGVFLSTLQEVLSEKYSNIEPLSVFTDLM